MTLRTRLALAALSASALAVVGVAVLGVWEARQELRSQVDASLIREAARIAVSQLVTGDIPAVPAGTTDLDDALRLAGGTSSFQVIDEAGVIKVESPFVRALDIEPDDLAVAKGQRGDWLRDRTIEDEHFRIITVSAGHGLAVQVVRPLDDVDRTVRAVTIGSSVIVLIGVGLAGLFGVLVARRALRPVAELSAAAHRVAVEQDPGLSVPQTGGAELEGLGESINTMLRALDGARQQQRRLIDDAAHELRTPLTSMRTNVEVLAGGRLAPGPERDELLVDLRDQLEEFSSLVGDLEELARDDLAVAGTTDVPLVDVLDAAVRRAQRRAGSTAIDVSVIDPGTVMGTQALLERATLNLLDNAVKWSPHGSAVEVTLRGTDLEVADHGPGIPPEEAQLVFERFWRSPSARSMPGSGLGLAIVQQVVEVHHGHVSIGPNAGGGTRVHLWFPPAEP